MFGRFLEFAIATRDIAASVQFYERLGFRVTREDDRKFYMKRDADVI